MLNISIKKLLISFGVMAILTQSYLMATEVKTTIDNQTEYDIEFVTPAKRMSRSGSGWGNLALNPKYRVPKTMGKWIDARSLFESSSTIWAPSAPETSGTKACIKLKDSGEKFDGIVLDDKDRTYLYLYPKKAMVEVIAGLPTAHSDVEWGNFDVYNYTIKVTEDVSVTTTIKNDSDYEIRLVNESVLEAECLETDWLSKNPLCYKVGEDFVLQGLGFIELKDGSNIGIQFDGNDYKYSAFPVDVEVKAKPIIIVSETGFGEFYTYTITVTPGTGEAPEVREPEPTGAGLGKPDFKGKSKPGKGPEPKPDSDSGTGLGKSNSKGKPEPSEAEKKAAEREALIKRLKARSRRFK